MGGREETVNWITQWVIELRSCWTWKANCQCMWVDENHRSSVQLPRWVFPWLIRATFTSTLRQWQPWKVFKTKSFSLVCFGKQHFNYFTQKLRRRHFAESSRNSLPWSEIIQWSEAVKSIIKVAHKTCVRSVFWNHIFAGKRQKFISIFTANQFPNLFTIRGY